MAPPKTSAPKKDLKKVVAGKVGGKRRRRRRRRTPRTDGLFSLYVHRLMKGIHPDLSFSSKTMSVINSFIVDIFERLAGEASRLMRHTGRTTLMPRDIQTAVRLLLPGVLGQHVVSEGLRAVTEYNNSQK